MTIAARFTREEHLALPASPPGVRFELLDRELVTTNDPLPLHQKAVARYLAAGVDEVWLVRTDPLGATIVRADGKTDEVEPGGALCSPLLPGLALPVGSLLD